MKMASQSTKLRLSAAAAALFLACTLASASSSSIYSPSRKVFSVLRFAKDRVPGLGGKGIAMVRDGHGDEVLEYDDFSEMVPFLAKSGIAPMDRKQKRYCENIVYRCDFGFRLN